MIAVPRQRFQPIEIEPGVYSLVSLGCRVFAFLDRDVTLLDTGIQGSAPLILRQLERLGRRPEDVRRIILTHYHFDHAAGVAQMVRLTGAEVLIHTAEAPYLCGELRYPSPFRPQPLPGLTRWGYRRFMPPPVPVTHLVDGDVVPVVGGLRIHHIPGHTPGSIALQSNDLGLLFTGDTLQHRFGRLTGPASLFTESMASARQSIDRLSELDFDSVCFSHFPPLRREARTRVRQLVATWAPSGNRLGGRDQDDNDDTGS